jgi:hypothetical protein
MAITINGTGTITGISAGGLPDGSVTADDLATNLDLSSKVLTGTGLLKQVVATTMTDTFNTTTANVFQQITGLNTNITTTSDSSKVLIFLTVGQASTANGASGSFALSRDGTRILVGAAAGQRGQTSIKYYGGSSSHSSGFSFIGVDTPGTAGTYTYGLQASAQGGTTLYVNRTQINSDTTDSYEHRPASHLTLVEIG